MNQKQLIYYRFKYNPKCEFTVAEYLNMSETGQRKDDAMYKGNLVPSQEALKGNSATCM